MTSTKRIEEDGYYLAERLFDRSELDEVKRVTNDVIESAVDGEKQPLEMTSDLDQHYPEEFRLTHVCLKYAPFLNLALDDRILDIVEGVLGPHVAVTYSDIRYKPEDIDNEINWHRDISPELDPLCCLDAWIPLYDVTVETGCLKVAPGTHTEHFDDLEDWNSEKENYEREYVEMDAGDVLFFSPKIMHGSDEVTTSKPRHALRVIYKRPSVILTNYPERPMMVRGGNVHVDPDKL